MIEFCPSWPVLSPRIIDTDMLHGNTKNRQNPFVFTDQYGVVAAPINYPRGNGTAASGCAESACLRAERRRREPAGAGGGQNSTSHRGAAMGNDGLTGQPPGIEVEVEPGYFVTRRLVLGSALAALLPWRLSAAADGGGLGFGEFLALANPLARELVADATAAGQDRYLGSLGALAGRLSSVPEPARWNESDQGEAPGSVAIGVNPGGEAFTVLHWRLEPGARVRPHAHTYGNVVTLGLAGFARVQNYEMAGEWRDRPDFETSAGFVVQQTVDQALRPGAINLVSLARNYIHGMQAGPDGARGLDITTRIGQRPAYGTPYLVIDDGPLDPLARTYQARWIRE